jgi:drug/metabolite transporter superfamily protein YnfA
MFTKIENGYAILSSRGVVRQVNIYERKGRIYAQHGGGFISLTHRNSTSVPTVRLDEVHADGLTIHHTDVGYLVNPVNLPTTHKGKTTPYVQN